MLECQNLNDVRVYIVASKKNRPMLRLDIIFGLLVALFAYYMAGYISNIALAISAVAAVLFPAGAWKIQNFGRVKEERVLVVQDLGVQLSTEYYDGRVKNCFIDNHNIQDIIINEGFSCCKVIFYMAIIVAGDDTMRLVFANSNLRFKELRRVYQGVRAIMYNEPEDEDL